MRVLLDGTPMLGRRTGIGRYTTALADQLGRMPGVDARAIAFSLRGWRRFPCQLPDGVTRRGVPVPARMLRAAWRRNELPPIELLAGAHAVVHGTNFLLPPTARGAGVLTVHDLDFLDHRGELPPALRSLPEILHRSLRRANVVCVPTVAVAEQLCARYAVPADRVVVTPMGVDASWFTARPADATLRGRLGLPGEYLVFVGERSPRKGLATLLEAHRMRPGLPPLAVIGPAAAGGASTAAQQRRVLQLGYLADAELRSVVAGASALVLPSRDEGFGMPVLEALACGVPVVCSDIPALREVAGGHAALVRPGDPEALGEALATALARSVTHAGAGRRHAAAFTWQRCTESTVEAYRRATL